MGEGKELSCFFAKPCRSCFVEMGLAVILSLNQKNGEIRCQTNRLT